MNNRTHFLITMLLFLFVLSPVSAQTPEPPPPLPSTRTLLTEVSDAVQAIGIVQFIAAVLVIAVLIFAWKGLSPLLKAFKDAQEQVAAAQRAIIELVNQQAQERQQINQARSLQAESLLQTVKAQEGLAQIMSNMETRTEAQKRSDAQVDSIKEHTTQAIDSLKTSLEAVSSGVEQLKADLAGKIDKGALDAALKPILDTLRKIDEGVSEVQNAVSLIDLSLKANADSSKTDSTEDKP